MTSSRYIRNRLEALYQHDINGLTGILLSKHCKVQNCAVAQNEIYTLHLHSKKHSNFVKRSLIGIWAVYSKAWAVGIKMSYNCAQWI